MKTSSLVILVAAVFAALPISTTHAAIVSINTGSLGILANGVNSETVTESTGVVAVGGDLTARYSGAPGSLTTVPFLPALNPILSTPFTVEFWANPASSDNDDSPLSNRLASVVNRSGWVFFQREPGTGWNFRMYNGVLGVLGWDLTGGTSTLNAWSHVVATWNGTSAALYVNGVLADNTNEPTATGIYSPNIALGTNLLIGSTDTGSPYNGAVDEVAFYNLALSPTQIQSHFNAAASVTPDAYFTLIQNDGALLQLSNNIPEPSSALLLAASMAAFGFRRSRAY